MNHQGNVHSVLADHIRTFLAHQRALGKRFETEEAGLRQLERYLLVQQVTTLEAITPAVLEAFVLSHPRQPRSVNSLLSTLRRFFGWLVFHEVLIQSPLQGQPFAILANLLSFGSRWEWRISPRKWFPVKARV